MDILFNRSILTLLAFLLFRQRRFNFFASPAFLPRDPQRQSRRVKRHERMKESSATDFAVHRPRTLDLLMGTRYIEFRCVLDEQHKLALRYSFERCLDVRLENSFRRDFVVIKETISRFHFCPSMRCRRNAQVRLGPQFFDHLAKSLVQPLVAKLRSMNFVHQRNQHSKDLRERIAVGSLPRQSLE